jgi:hypothetical protein
LTDTEFTIGAHHYRADRLNARQQFDVARRLSYVLTTLGAEKSPEFKPTPENFARIILVTSGMIPQSDMDAALNICLGAVKRKLHGDLGWGPIVASNGALIHDDIDMATMLELVWHIVSAHRMVDFLSASARASAAPKTGD